MHNLNPTRVVARRGRDAMIIGALLLISGLLAGLVAVLVLLLFSSTVVGVIFGTAAAFLLLIGFGFFIRGLTLRTENEPALAVSHVLASELGDRFTFVRNVSRRGLGYIDAVLVGPPGALVFRITDQPGIFLNEGADWLERQGGAAFKLSRHSFTRECVTDVYALRSYLAKRGLSQVPVYGIVVFTAQGVQLTARQPVIPIAELRTLMMVIRRDFLLEDRIDMKMVEGTVNAIYQ